MTEATSSCLPALWVRSMTPWLGQDREVSTLLQACSTVLSRRFPRQLPDVHPFCLHTWPRRLLPCQPLSQSAPLLVFGRPAAILIMLPLPFELQGSCRIPQDFGAVVLREEGNVADQLFGMQQVPADVHTVQHLQGSSPDIERCCRASWWITIAANILLCMQEVVGATTAVLHLQAELEAARAGHCHTAT